MMLFLQSGDCAEYPLRTALRALCVLACPFSQEELLSCGRRSGGRPAACIPEETLSSGTILGHLPQPLLSGSITSRCAIENMEHSTKRIAASISCVCSIKMWAENFQI